ncbi:MAG: transporter [Myxococcota bacterium]
MGSTTLRLRDGTRPARFSGPGWATLGRAVLAALPVCLLPAAGLAAGDPPPTARQQAEVIAAQGRQIDAQAEALRLLREQISALQSAMTMVVAELSSKNTGDEGETKVQAATQEPERSQQQSAGSETSPRASDSTSRQAATSEPADPESMPDDRKTSAQERDVRLAEAIPIRTGGVLLPRGNLTIEPQLRYSHASVNAVEITGFQILPALTLGLIDLTRQSRSTLTSTLSVRYGLTDRIELDFAVPYVASWNRLRLTSLAGTSDKNLETDGYGIGDLQFGLRTQLNRGTDSIASFVAALGARFPTGKSPYDVKRRSSQEQFSEAEVPTGSGFYSLSPSLSFVYPTEPGVLFGNLHYSWNIARKISAIQPDTEEAYGRIDPGDVIGAGIGIGLSLNDKLSLSLSYDHSLVLQPRLRGSFVENSVPLQIGTLGIGATKRRNSKTSYSFMVGIGVTDDAPDVSVTFRVPTNVDLSSHLGRFEHLNPFR